MLMAVGFLRLGTYIKYIPHPVTVGFTSGIAVIIFSSQITDLFGLTLPGREPAAFVPKLAGHRRVRPARSAPAALVVTARHRWRHPRAAALRPHWPGFLIAIARRRRSLSLLLATAGFAVATIGSQVRRHPQHPARPALPPFSLEKIAAVLPDAVDLRAAGRHRIAALGRGRGRHDRPPPPLELRARGAGRRQYRLGAVRRHLRHRHHRAHRHQCPRRRAGAGRRHDPRGRAAAADAGGRAARLLHPARGARRRAGRRVLEHGGEGRVRRHPATLARRRAGAAGDLPAHRLPRPHRGHRASASCWAR